MNGFHGQGNSIIAFIAFEGKNINPRVRVNNFREKSSAGIDGLKLGAGFEQDC